MNCLLLAFLITNALFWGLFPHTAHCQVVSEFNKLYEFYGDVEIKPMLTEISNSVISNTIIAISRMLPFFADIRLESGQPRVKTILDGDILKRIMISSIESLVVKHLKEQNVSYIKHWWRAMKISGALFIHAFLPDVLSDYASKEICDD